MPSEDEHRTGVGLENWGDQFPETHWSILIHDSGETLDPVAAEQRFTDLCSRYWYPLYAYLRRRGRTSHDAQDLTQGFFAHLLSGDRIGGLDPKRGKFRSYLLGAMEHFLNDRRKYESAQKRGGGKPPISIEEELAEQRFQNEPAENLSAEVLFDRKWALAVIHETKRQLEREYREQGKRHIFEKLGGYLTAEPETGGYTAIASDLELTVENVRKIVSRMKARFRDLLRAQVRVTVSSEAEIDDEIRHLLGAFG